MIFSSKYKKYIIFGGFAILLLAIVFCNILNPKKINQDNSFIIFNMQPEYTQGEVIVYTQRPSKLNPSCKDINAQILNYKKNVVGQGYCNIIDNNIAILVDTSEFIQGKYYLKINTKNKSYISNNYFNIQLVNLREIVGSKKE